MGICHSILMTIALMQSPQAKSKNVFVDHVQGACVLQNFEDNLFEDNLEGGWRGVRIWFGKLLHLKLSFFVRDANAGTPNSLRQNGEISKASFIPVGSYFEFYSAFFDDKHNLIACEGGGPGFGKSPVNELEAAPGLPMPLPIGFHEQISTYKMTYYESSGEIRTGRCRDLETARTGDKPLLDRNSGRASRSPPFSIRSGSRLLEGSQKGWIAETTEGKIALKELTANTDKTKKSPAVMLPAGKGLSLEVKCQLSINENNFVTPWVSVKNTTDSQKYCQFYLALFDEEGNLVCCVNYPNIGLEPHGTMPKMTIGGKSMSEAFWASRLMEIPLGFKDRIASYKITVYESEQQIGAPQTQKNAEVK